ncbi:geranylgeranyl diphosphate reductase [Fulvimarina endophytica]|uniref:geranylgeranyl diphosphate reductase n=1 Tax=Fulvimarina endophytica TaxID=2293836 RepID=A0A371X6R4_9HYPH|nr:geranylgeranyl diphosphate reductase [Fulvimarina endophytica]RFC64935.1 geranylgeranyl diphosphate reductase [Fulvimarina endophytica]
MTTTTRTDLRPTSETPPKTAGASGPGIDDFDAVVIGGGPAGATAALRLREAGFHTAMIERGGRIKPCGGAIPPRLIEDFAIPQHLLKARISSARMIAPSGKTVDMPIDGGYVGMVDREEFDEWLRERAAARGVVRITGVFDDLADGPTGRRQISYKAEDGSLHSVRARLVIGADGARSAVAKKALPNQKQPKSVFAYHEIVEADGGAAECPMARADRCDVFYQGAISPDFYGWVFPHGKTVSIGTGTAKKGYGLRKAVADLRAASGYEMAGTVRREGAPIPLKPMKRWDDGRNVIVAGDAAGVVAPASGEGIYYAMESARIVADCGIAFLRTGEASELARARKIFMGDHGTIFMILGMLQSVWYRSDWLRERFVSICRDPDVQRLTWESYMHKRMSKASPTAHARILWQNLGHYLGWRTA